MCISILVTVSFFLCAPWLSASIDNKYEEYVYKDGEHLNNDDNYAEYYSDNGKGVGIADDDYTYPDEYEDDKTDPGTPDKLYNYPEDYQDYGKDADMPDKLYNYHDDYKDTSEEVGPSDKLYNYHEDYEDDGKDIAVPNKLHNYHEDYEDDTKEGIDFVDYDYNYPDDHEYGGKGAELPDKGFTANVGANASGEESDKYDPDYTGQIHIDKEDAAELIGNWTTEWGPWTACSTTCGTGRQQRRRYSSEVKQEKEYGDCKQKDCPSVDCKVSAWSEWSKCMGGGECGSSVVKGEKHRFRDIIILPENRYFFCFYIEYIKICSYLLI